MKNALGITAWSGYRAAEAVLKIQNETGNGLLIKKANRSLFLVLKR